MSVEYTKFQIQAFQKFGVIPVFTEGKPRITQLNKRVENETLNAWCRRVIGLPSRQVKFFSLDKFSGQMRVETLAEKNIELRNVFTTKVKRVKTNLRKKMQAQRVTTTNPLPEQLSPGLIAQTMREAVLFMPPSMEEFIDRFAGDQDEACDWPTVFESLFERYVELAKLTINANLLAKDEEDEEDEEEEDEEDEFNFDEEDDTDTEDDTDPPIEITENDKTDILDLINVLTEKPEVLTIQNDFRFSKHYKYDDFSAEYGIAARYMILLDDLEEYVTEVDEAFSSLKFLDSSDVNSSFRGVSRTIDYIKNKDGFPPASELDDPDQDRTDDEKEQIEYITSCVYDLIDNIHMAFEEVEFMLDEILEDEDSEDNVELIKAVKDIQEASDTCSDHMLYISNLLFEG